MNFSIKTWGNPDCFQFETIPLHSPCMLHFYICFTFSWFWLHSKKLSTVPLCAWAKSSKAKVGCWSFESPWSTSFKTWSFGNNKSLKISPESQQWERKIPKNPAKKCPVIQPLCKLGRSESWFLGMNNKIPNITVRLGKSTVQPCKMNSGKNEMTTKIHGDLPNFICFYLRTTKTFQVPKMNKIHSSILSYISMDTALVEGKPTSPQKIAWKK